jgi:hypothetical protein
MATILSFQPGARQASDTPRASAHRAEIVLFPGVRYERLSEPPKPAKKRRARRDKIELQD